MIQLTDVNQAYINNLNGICSNLSRTLGGELFVEPSAEGKMNSWSSQGIGVSVPQPKDSKDIYAHVRWFLWLGPRPSFDRFAYWEKFDYWAVFWGMAIIGLSGYAMWFAQFFAKFLPGSWLNVALLLHGEEALLAVWFIFTIHFFNTHLRPGSFPMDLVIFTGKETEKELREKRTQQYQRLLEEGKLGLTAVAPPSWLNIFGQTVGWVTILTGFVLLWLTLTSFFRTGAT